NSSLHVSMAVVAFSLITILEHHLEIDTDLLIFIFLASITGYNFVKYAGVAGLHHLSLAGNLRFIQVFSLASFLALIYFSLKLDMEVLIATGVLGIFTLLYALPVFGGEKNLRSLPGIKIFIIAIVWAGSTVLLPLINAGLILDIDFLVDFLQRLFLVVVLTLPFEIRDLNYDHERLGTIPQKIGVLNSKVFGSILMLLIGGSELFQISMNSSGFFPLFLLLIIAGIFLWRSGRKQGKYYASFWVESLPIVYLGFYLLFRYVLPQILF
ncbi:MAG: hypothetical protein KJP01_01715, partial [Gramella sp.]|nr:hypothetical protein [Christiangramia sp.]